MNCARVALCTCGDKLCLPVCSHGTAFALAVLTVPTQGGDLRQDLTSYDLACPKNQYMTGLDIYGGKWQTPEAAARKDDFFRDVIGALGPLYCSGGWKVGPKVPQTADGAEKWSPRAPNGQGYSGINLSAGQVLDAIGLEVTNGKPS